MAYSAGLKSEGCGCKRNCSELPVPMRSMTIKLCHNAFSDCSGDLHKITRYPCGTMIPLLLSTHLALYYSFPCIIGTLGFVLPLLTYVCLSAETGLIDLLSVPNTGPGTSWMLSK